MDNFEAQKNLKALAGTVLVHVAILLCCLLIGFSTPAPLPNQDLGMEVNLGNSQEGMGEVQPLHPNPPLASNTENAHAQAHPADKTMGTVAHDVLTQNDEPAPAISHTQPTSPKTFHPDLNEKQLSQRSRPQQAPVEPRPTPPRPKALYSGGIAHSTSSGNQSNISNSSTGEGLTGRPGDQGAINGNPNASNHQGLVSGLGGSGISYSLSGRSITQYPSREAQFNEPGRVRMRIAVDQQGNITHYQILSADNATIAALAERKIKQIRFNADPNAPVTQFGEITFVFRLQQ
ncbi:MAG: energy transducer TonB [Thermoflavifilum sp.]|nr:energy transducer TonB [Thermoflavifilum sp.]